MARKERDYSNLRETERVHDAVKMHNTEVKDYSLTHLVGTGWKLNDEQSSKRLVHIDIGGKRWIGKSTELWTAINEMVGEANDDGWLPRGAMEIPGVNDRLIISTIGVNDECLRDHVAQVTVDKNTAILDLEELLKATRYA